MIKEAKERVTRMLKAKIQESRIEEAQNVLTRAERSLSDASSHPLAGDLRTKVEELKQLVDDGAEDKIDNVLDDVIRVLTQIEAAG
jgi:hypothetical protein